ncbi:MAG: DNA alkylation repair protein [Bacteroidales bacterium]|nr:DNA alkylation repair protein [Bacteroidales bacterium]
MKTYLAPLVREYESHSAPQTAIWAKKYLKDQFEMLGVGTTARRQLMKAFFCEYGYPPPGQWKDFCIYLWQLPEREYQYTVLDALRKHTKKLNKEDILWIEELIVSKSWWDTVDGLAAWIVGDYFRKFPEQIIPVTGRWMDSGNLWLQRTCLLYQLTYKEDLDTALLSRFIEKLADHKDFFIRKAIGWILRQYSKTNPRWVGDFLASHELSGLSRREGSKYI